MPTRSPQAGRVVIAVEVPGAARGPAIDPTRGYLIEDLRGGAYRVTDGDYQALLVTDRRDRGGRRPPSLAPHLPAAEGVASAAQKARADNPARRLACQNRTYPAFDVPIAASDGRRN
jgi:hypothetical protein